MFSGSPVGSCRQKCKVDSCALKGRYTLPSMSFHTFIVVIPCDIGLLRVTGSYVTGPPRMSMYFFQNSKQNNWVLRTAAAAVVMTEPAFIRISSWFSQQANHSNSHWILKKKESGQLYSTSIDTTWSSWVP